jgi:serine/threonine protein kinase
MQACIPFPFENGTIMIQAGLTGQTLVTPNGNCFHVLHEIGHGGFGTVYKAETSGSGKPVAIKTPRPVQTGHASSGMQYARRFEQEVRICDLLHHPNIMQLLHRGWLHSGEPFAVYEYVDGITLQEYLMAQENIGPATAGYLMLQLLEALVYLHSNNIVHGDLKPQNILIMPADKGPLLKLLDFGSSILLTDAAVASSHNPAIIVFTTASYAAPEQLQQQLPSAKSDLYSWGLLLLECLTGQPAIKGNTIAAILENQLSDKVVPIPASITDKSLKSLLSKVLDKDIYLRAGNAKLVADSFRNINFTGMDLQQTTPPVSAMDADLFETGINNNFSNPK